MKLFEALEDKIFHYCIVNNKRTVSLIVMSPKTFDEMLEEKPLYTTQEFIKEKKYGSGDFDLRYKGIKVLRSLDLPDGHFEIA